MAHRNADAIFVEDILKPMLLKDLRIQCRARGLNPGGSRDVLLDRLKENMLETGDLWVLWWIWKQSHLSGGILCCMSGWILVDQKGNNDLREFNLLEPPSKLPLANLVTSLITNMLPRFSQDLIFWRCMRSKAARRSQLFCRWWPRTDWKDWARPEQLCTPWGPECWQREYLSITFTMNWKN